MPTWLSQALVTVLLCLYTGLRGFFRLRYGKPPAAPPQTPSLQLSAQAPRNAERMARTTESTWTRLLRKMLVGLFVLSALMYSVALPLGRSTQQTWAQTLTALSRLPIEILPVDATTLQWSGIALALLGWLLLLWSHLALARQWSPEIQIHQQHQLVRHGPYKRIRHPMYTSLFCFFLGLSVISLDLLIVLPAALVSLLLLLRTRTEERLLTRHFGLPYTEYLQVTGRFLPPLRQKKTTHRPR